MQPQKTQPQAVPIRQVKEIDEVRAIATSKHGISGSFLAVQYRKVKKMVIEQGKERYEIKPGMHLTVGSVSGCVESIFPRFVTLLKTNLNGSQYRESLHIHEICVGQIRLSH